VTINGDARASRRKVPNHRVPRRTSIPNIKELDFYPALSTNFFSGTPSPLQIALR